MITCFSDSYFPELSWSYHLNGRSDFFYLRRGIRPCRREKDYDCQFPAPEILLVPYVLIGGNQDVIAFLFSSANQFSIGKALPSIFCSGSDYMGGQAPPERSGCTVIKQNFQCRLRVPAI